MGLAASQARLLNLTARMHDIEYKAQNLEAQKLQMANESTQVYKEYETALNKQKVQFKHIGADGSAVYRDASVQTLINAGYQIKILNGNRWYDYNNVDGTWQRFESTMQEVTVTALANDQNAGAIINEGGTNYKLAKPAYTGQTTIYAYQEIRPTAEDTAATAQLDTIDLTSVEVLRNLVEAGFIVFEKPMTDGTIEEVNIATDTNLQEVSDETELKKAEAKYEADMRKIDAKDKKFDTDLAAMEAERNAIKTEIETLKTVAKDNVDRTFKLFS